MFYSITSSNIVSRQCRNWAIYLLCLICLPSLSWSQDKKTTLSQDNVQNDQNIEEQENPENIEESEDNTLAEAGKLHIGEDPTVFILIALFLLAVVVAVDRIVLLVKEKGSNVELADLIINNLKKMPYNVDHILSEINKGGYGTEGKIIFKTLMGWEHGEVVMKEFAQAALIAEKRKLEKRLVILATLGNNTPFIGLLGTVLGIMKAFRDLALMGDAGPAVVMRGISEALIATAFGLGVAIPCVIANNAIGKIVRVKLSNAEEMVNLICGFCVAKSTGKAWHELPQPTERT